jgi:hypothetical protein
VQEFVKCNLAYHVGLDEGALTTWFANALMRDWDEYRWRSKEYKRFDPPCDVSVVVLEAVLHATE